MSTDIVKFNFVEETDDDLAREVAEAEAAKARKSQWLKLKVPFTDIRILPAMAEWGTKSVHQVREHYVDLKETGFLIEGQDKSFSFECPEANGTGHCPLCALGRSGASTDEPTSRMIRVQDRYYANVLNMEDPAAGVFRAALPKSVYEAIRDMAAAKGAPILSTVAHGVVFRIKRTGMGQKDTKYTVMDLRAYPLSDTIDSLVPNMENLRKFPRQLTGELRASLEMNITTLFNVDVSANGRGSSAQPKRSIGAGSVRGQARRVDHDDTY